MSTLVTTYMSTPEKLYILAEQSKNESQQSWAGQCSVNLKRARHASHSGHVHEEKESERGEGRITRGTSDLNLMHGTLSSLRTRACCSPLKRTAGFPQAAADARAVGTVSGVEVAVAAGAGLACGGSGCNAQLAVYLAISCAGPIVALGPLAFPQSREELASDNMQVLPGEQCKWIKSCLVHKRSWFAVTAQRQLKVQLWISVDLNQ